MNGIRVVLFGIGSTTLLVHERTIICGILDSYLRILNQIIPMGSRPDSWGDFIIYSTTAICVRVSWPDIILREKLYFIIIVLSFTLPVLIGFIKFHTISRAITHGV